MVNKKFSIFLSALVSILMIFTLAACGSGKTSSSTNQTTAPADSAPKAAAPAAFPSKAVEIIAPASPGGGWDATARAVAKAFQEEKLVSQPINVVNKPGGSGAVGWSYLNEHEKDAHYLSMNSTLIHSNSLKGTSPLKASDFTPLAMLTTEWMSVAVGKDSPIQTGKELMDKLKQDPTSMVIGIGAGLGNDDHVAIIKAAKSAGVDVKKLKVVVFDSGGDLITALLGGHVDIISTGLSEAVEQQKAGKLKILAITADKRLEGELADLPTWAEQGIDGTFSHWRGIMGPKGMTEEQVKAWDDLLGKMVQTKTWKDMLAQQGWVDAYQPSAEYKATLEKEYSTFADLLTELGLVKK